MMTSQEKKALLAAITTAGKLAQQYRDEGLSIKIKGRQDFVSQADEEVEKHLKTAILSLFPNDGFLGEEGGLQLGSRGVWVIDPIDGTSNYLQGMDYWCISVAYVVDNDILLGIVYAPDRSEMFIAEKDKGATLNGETLKVEEPLSGRAMIGLGHSNRYPFKQYLNTLTVLDQQHIEHRRFGAGALMLAHVAAGLVHGYYEAHLNSWDALAGLLIIREAGGKTNDFLTNNGLINGSVTWAATPELWQTLANELLNKFDSPSPLAPLIRL